MLNIEITDNNNYIAYKKNIVISKEIDNILWRLGFTSYFKGTIYLKEAILLAYLDNELLLNMKELVKRVAKKCNIENERNVRSAMDKSLNTTLDFIDTTKIYSIFKNDYDGRKISLKYFINLLIHHLKKVMQFVF